MPGIAVSILVVGLSAVVFFTITNLIAMRFAGTAPAEAWLDLFGNSSS